MAQHAISERQKQYLQEARRGEAYGVFRALQGLVLREDPGKREPLSPEWRQLWEGAREPALRAFGGPPGWVEEIDKAILAIPLVDPDILQVRLVDGQKVALLLGAGASAPDPSSIPTVNGLLPELWRRAKKLGREDIDGLAEWCEAANVTNIEDLLTAAYVANFAATNTSVTGLLDYFLFRVARAEAEEESSLGRRRRGSMPRVNAASVALLQDTLQTLFGLLMGTMIPAKPNAAHKAVAHFVRSHGATSIITTNYDGCIDEALETAKLGYNTFMAEGGQSPEQSEVALIKIHGSINWSYCDSCQEAREFKLLSLKETYEKDTQSYPVIGICKTCGGQRRPLLVPPMGFKFIMFPNLISLWETARQRIEQAHYLVVVGYSFSEADTYLSKIISRSMTKNIEQRIIVCDPNASLADSLRNRFAAHIDGFDPRRVLQAAGPCEEHLGQILLSFVSNSAADRAPLHAETKPALAEGVSSSEGPAPKPGVHRRKRQRQGK